MNALTIIEQFYTPGTPLYQTLVHHSRIVTQKSLAIARTLDHLNPNLEFIKTAAMLHDIGIFMTRSTSIGCVGVSPYICHGYLGRKLLDEQGLPQEYGLVCERHTGAGITRENITTNHLPLPARDMVPVSLEEKIICCADKYHSKNPKKKDNIITTADIIQELGAISMDHADRFSTWAQEFNL
ncbi:MAG: HDIG domain-containing metalloprotein [Pseudomonadota bacterium]